MFDRVSRLLMVAVVLGFGLSSAVHANVLTNPGFETGDMTSWGMFRNDGDDGVTDVDPYAGTYHLQLTTDGDPQPYTGATQTIAATPGEVWHGRIWAKTDNGSANLKLTFRGAAGVLATFTVSTQNNAYTLLEILTDPAPAGTTTLYFEPVAVGGSTTNIVTSYFDNAELAQVIPTPSALGSGLVCLAMLALRRRR